MYVAEMSIVSDAAFVSETLMPQAIHVTDRRPPGYGPPGGPAVPGGDPAEGPAQELPPYQCSMAIIRFRTKMKRSADVIDPPVSSTG